MRNETTLPKHLAPHWEGRPDPRVRPNFCAKQGRRTPETPWHSGVEKCSACGFALDPVWAPGRKRLKKDERLTQAAFTEEATMMLECLGATPNDGEWSSYPLKMGTVAGTLLAHVHADCVHMMFVDVDRAKQHVRTHHQGGCLNPHSGKWNVGLYGSTAPLEGRLRELRRHLSEIFTLD